MRIMIYYDCVDHARKIITVVKQHAQSFHAMIDIVGFIHSTDKPQFDEIRKNEDDLQYIKTILGNDNIPCVTHMLISDDDEGVDLCRFIHENAIDEIILGTDRDLAIVEPIPGSLEDQVISNARCPVVFV